MKDYVTIKSKVKQVKRIMIREVIIAKRRDSK